jgi:hypothetical protein
MTEHRCVYCNGDRLMSPHESSLERGSVVICGRCGSPMIVDVRLPWEDPESPDSKEPFLRRPTDEESKAMRQDPAVVAALDAYNLVTLEQATKSKKKRTRRIVQRGRANFKWSGPDHGFIRGALLALVGAPLVCLGVGFWFGFVAGSHFHP